MEAGFVLLGICFMVFGGFLFLSANAILQQIAALSCLIITAIYFTGAGIAGRLAYFNDLQKEKEKEKLNKTMQAVQEKKKAENKI